MPIDTVQFARIDATWGAMGALHASDGCADHRHLRALSHGVVQMRDLSDAVHHLCMLHGRHPGVIDHAFEHATLDAERGWLESAAEGFATERAFLVRLAAAAGPLPSTPGQAEAEATCVAQRHAIDMLSQSDRIGCATGAAVALVLDWTGMRRVLDIAADRLGMTPPEWALPPIAETVTIVTELANVPSRERAMLFGAQQLYAQHRGLWDLLEARAGARQHD
ncbi:MAG: DUF6975 family protein [Pseudomonadota bacterium]